MRVLRTCEYCSSHFYAPVKEINRGYGRFCSRKCSAAYGNIRRKRTWRKQVLNKEVR